MPFRSEKQRRFLWKFHPNIAHAWAHGQHTTLIKKRTRGGHRHKKPSFLTRVINNIYGRAMLY